MKYQFHLTCYACPEQYDVMDGHLIVANVRYRSGCLTVNPVLPKRETAKRVKTAAVSDSPDSEGGTSEPENGNGGNGGTTPPENGGGENEE